MLSEIQAALAPTPDTYSDALATYQAGLNQLDGQIIYHFENNRPRSERLQAFKSLYITMASTIMHYEDAKARASELRQAAQDAVDIQD